MATARVKRFRASATAATLYFDLVCAAPYIAQYVMPTSMLYYMHNNFATYFIQILGRSLPGPGPSNYSSYSSLSIHSTTS